MVADRARLERAWWSGRELSIRRQSDPLRYMRWLPLQHEFLTDPSLVKQIRAGNQTIGKTWCALAEVIGRCLGRHPLGPSHDGTYRQPPIEAWVVCASWPQSVGIQAKLWSLLPKRELTDRVRYDAVAGFAPTKQPVVEFRNGSIIRIRTTGQEELDFAGATIAVVLFDEPPRHSRTYTEALMRVQELGGVLLLSYTPINAPVDYLRKLVEGGQISDHWRPLTPAELIPVGQAEPLRAKDGRLKDAAWIADREAKVPEHERGVVVHGEWETRAVGAYFEPVFRVDQHVAEIRPTGRWQVLLGVDHGHQPGKQSAVLVYVRVQKGRAQVYVVDEYIDRAGTATPEDDALGILAMLARHDLSWHSLDAAHGDRIHMKGQRSEKSNADLMTHLAVHLGVRGPRHLRPQVETVKVGEGRGAGSVETGTRWLYHQMAIPGGFTLHPRCTAGRHAIERYVAKDDEHGSKDWLDALRYALDDQIFDTGPRDPGPQVRFKT